jgi:hypothetical protein
MKESGYSTAREREREDTDRIPKRALKGKQKREKKHGTSEEKMVG